MGVGQNNENTLVLKGDGNVGIETTAPGSRLTVSQTTGQPIAAIGKDITVTGTNSFGLGFAVDGVTVSGNESGFFGAANSATVSGHRAYLLGMDNAGDYVTTQDNSFSIMGGNVGILTTTPSRNFFVNGSAGGTGAWIIDSDKRLKENIETIDGALDKILSLRGVYFDWIDKKNHSANRQMGLIAQEAENIIPEVVDSSTEYYSMQYAPLTALLIEGLKEFHVEVEKNFVMVKAMQGRIVQLELINEKQSRKIAMLEKQNKRIKAENKTIKSFLCYKFSDAPFCN